MNYYYDVEINPQDKYIYFYEWDTNDEKEYAKKILIVNINSITFENILFSKFKVSPIFLEKIYNKCKLKNGNLIPYMCIFSDTKNAFVVEFDNGGNSIFKSSLLLEDEINVCELTYNVDRTNLEYNIIEKEENNKETVQESKIKKTIMLEIEKCYADKNINKLKFLFLEWFNYLEDDIDKIINKMYLKLDKKITDDEYKIYNIIKISYNNV